MAKRFERFSLLVALMLIPARFAAAAPSGFFLPFDFSAADPRGVFDPDTGTGATPAETVESLVPNDFACSDSVTLFTSIRLKPAAAANQTLDFTFSFLQQPTGHDGAGFAPNLTSASIVDGLGRHAGAATATIVHEAVDTSGPHDKLLSTVRVSDLDAGETLFLRLDIRLVCQPGSHPTGVLQAALESIAEHGDELQAGRQVVPLKVDGVPQAPPEKGTPGPGGEDHPKARGRITVVEKAKGYRDFFFSFFDVATSTEQRFRLDVDPISATPDRTTFGDLEPGLFQVTQRLVTEGYVLTSIQCTGGANARIGTDNDFDPGDITATIDLSAGDDVLCVFTNTKQSELQLAPAGTSGPNLTAATVTEASMNDLHPSASMPRISGDGATVLASQAADHAGEQAETVAGLVPQLGPRSTADRRSGAGTRTNGSVRPGTVSGAMVAAAAGASATIPWIALAFFLFVAPSILLTEGWRRTWVATVVQAPYGESHGNPAPRP
ncbi:MAG TPA: hypothetical protein VFV02_16585 [Acidimicrobiales bacterium]|nr:hypothetical protein [Acidimicrobiales bacterium]